MPRTAVGLAAVVAMAAQPAPAWTPAARQAIAEQAAALAPRDLTGQLERHRHALSGAAAAPCPGNAHDGGVRLAAAMRQEVTAAVAAIRAHRPFAEIVARLGTLAHLAADLNDPLRVDDGDPAEPRYAADYARYLDSARPRFAVIFYGGGRRLGDAGDLDRLLGRAVERGRRLYPDVAREYRRIGGRSGLTGFDDRSTAFAVGSLAYSHAVSDVAALLRYVWLEAGGSDRGALAAVAGDRLVLLGRGATAR